MNLIWACLSKLEENIGGEEMVRLMWLTPQQYQLYSRQLETKVLINMKALPN